MTYFELPSPTFSLLLELSYKYIYTSLNTWSLRFLQAPEKSTVLFLTLMYFRSSHHSLNHPDLYTLPMAVPNCGLSCSGHSCERDIAHLNPFKLERCRQEDTLPLRGLLGFLPWLHMHMDLEKDCRGRQLDTEGSGIIEANLFSNFGLEDSSDWDPSAGEMQPNRRRSEEELGSGRTILSFRNGKMGD